jgi:hypothetical protein
MCRKELLFNMLRLGSKTGRDESVKISDITFTHVAEIQGENPRIPMVTQTFSSRRRCKKYRHPVYDSQNGWSDWGRDEWRISGTTRTCSGLG